MTTLSLSLSPFLCCNCHWIIMMSDWFILLQSSWYIFQQPVDSSNLRNVAVKYLFRWWLWAGIGIAMSWPCKSSWQVMCLCNSSALRFIQTSTSAKIIHVMKLPKVMTNKTVMRILYLVDPDMVAWWILHLFSHSQTKWIIRWKSSGPWQLC